MKKLMYGHLVEVQMYKEILEKEGVTCFVKNEHEEGMRAGIGIGVPGNVDLYVDEQDLEKAAGVIKSYKESQA